jgi:hypothetical protein
MIMQHRGRIERPTGDIEVELTVSVTKDEARAMTWYAGGPIEVALQRIVRDRITRAVDAYRSADTTLGGPATRR